MPRLTEAEILKKAIEKAIKNGFEPQETGYAQDYYDCLQESAEDYKESQLYRLVYFHLIFNHLFAKAFWKSISCFHKGKEYRHVYSENGFCDEGQTEWQYHLQQMVLEENPIRYLEQFL